MKNVVSGSTDLPGSLGLYTGLPGSYQIACDGENIGFVGADGATGSRTNGVYRANATGQLTNLIDGNDIYPGAIVRTYHQRGYRFVKIDVSGSRFDRARTPSPFHGERSDRVFPELFNCF